MKCKKTRAVIHAGSLRKRIASWFRTHGRDLPWRRTNDPYAILVSEFMLQQTQVATVIPYFVRWMRRFPDFRALALASEADVLHAWAGLGYYSRARNLHLAAQQIVAAHGGLLPDDLAAIEALRGVGRYTAGAIASFAFDRAAPIVDANISRVLSRVFDLRDPIDSARGRALVWQTAEAILPRTGGRLHNSALMELGAIVCTPRAPRCLICPIRTHCATADPESLPRRKPRRKTVGLIEECAWIADDGRLLVEQQTGRRWHGLWKLPPAARRKSAPPLVELSYAFTHHRVVLRVYKEAARPACRTETWIPVDTLNEIAFPSPHRRVVTELLASPR